MNKSLNIFIYSKLNSFYIYPPGRVCNKSFSWNRHIQNNRSTGMGKIQGIHRGRGSFHNCDRWFKCHLHWSPKGSTCSNEKGKDM